MPRNQPPRPIRISDSAGRIECSATLATKADGEALRQVHRRAAADRQHRPEEAEHDQQHEGDDVVGDRVQAHRDDAEQLQAAALLVVAGEPAEQVAERPGDHRRDRPAGPRSRAARGRSASRPESERPTARARNRPRRMRLQKTQYCSQRRALEAVELAQRLPHHLDGVRGGVAEGGRRPRSTARPDRSASHG